MSPRQGKPATSTASTTTTTTTTTASTHSSLKASSIPHQHHHATTSVNNSMSNLKINPTTTTASTDTEYTSLAKRRILCLHGSSQTASIFRERLERLETRLGNRVTFTYLDGPIELPLKQGDQVRLRGWYQRDHHDHDHHQEQEICICEAVSLIKKIWMRLGPFDGVLGFSAGGVIASAIAMMPMWFQGLSFVMVAGTPYFKLCIHQQATGMLDMVPGYVKSMHAMGFSDSLVPVDESKRVCEKYFGGGGEVMVHEQGHIFPVRAEELGKWVGFLERGMRPSEGCLVAQQEEWEALEAIYGDDFEKVVVGGGGDVLSTTVLKVRLRLDDACRWSQREIYLRFRIGPTYPEALPFIELEHGMSMLEFNTVVESGVKGAVAIALKEMVGTAVIFEAVCCATRFLEDYQEGGEDDDENDIGADGVHSDDDTMLEDLEGVVTSSSKLNGQPVFSKNARGQWRHMIGLVGKPSAGKSTFFNCATRTTLAKVAAHPFTTIEPNVGSGWWSIPDSMMPTHLSRKQAGRLMPCLIKDVAGLVPGACQGRGRGNAFLNDLCDADVLIHVVDSSGLSDDDGNILVDVSEVVDGESGKGGPKGRDPMHDIKWVREELRLWIFGNVMKKWPSILKRPSKLMDMFSGYRAPRWLVEKAIHEGGLDPTVHGQYAKAFWTADAVARVVDVFLEMRFPILIALNKADLPGSAAHVARLTEAFGKGRAVPVCAAAEMFLQAEARKGTVEYVVGANGFRTLNGGGGETEGGGGAGNVEQWNRAKVMMERYGSTGVLEALTAAIMLRAPTLCFPVQDFESAGDSVDSSPVTGNGDATRTEMATAIALKPGTTVNDVFELISHGPDAKLAGQFVRAEGTALDGSMRRPLKKETPIDNTCAVVKFMSNKKSRWQNPSD
ncbi:hypothetical protein HDU76_014105 [Blyttiomyces sp. JEL0837]|nr:hypothetical protein HDU76_014105 [Blyttiomyces sp. JEL0837]